ncbi:uncharacterized protein LOC128241662 [Mya arenaria]|uniref:uncharacterized protein LOC128241662 n=1 Tax=Mya arenaria TaxID=6604 RepID=UPI0022E341EC|nr:uncharacterized protein LOC128241662 [Mya arenaria]
MRTRVFPSNWLLTLFLGFLVKGSFGLECFNCQHVANIQDCNTTTQCAAGESCFHQTEGETSTLGCVNNQNCTVSSLISPGLVGRRSTDIKLGRSSPSCHECCSTQLCNKQLCAHNKPSDCVDDPSIDCARMNSIIDICGDVDHAKLICSRFCGLCNIECPPNHIFDSVSSVCILLVETSNFTFSDAKAYCNSIGDQLIVIDTSEKSVFVNDVILNVTKEQQSAENYWIGAHAFNATSGKQFQWLNGQPLEFERWGADEPGYNPNEQCVLINGLDNNRWYDTYCTGKYRTICERLLNPHTTAATSNAATTPKSTTSLKTTSTSISLFTTTATIATTQATTKQTPKTTATSTTPSTTTKAPAHCPTHVGYTLYVDGHTRLCVHIVDVHVSWENAKRHCTHDHHGRLIVMDSHAKLTLMAHHKGNHDYWVGATDPSSNKQYSWLNGHPVASILWNTGQPNQQGQCVALVGNHLNDRSCNENYRYICEIPLL